MAARCEDHRLLSLVGPYEWIPHEHVRVIGGAHKGHTGTVINIGDCYMHVKCNGDGQLRRCARKFCEPEHHLTRRREAIPMAAYVESVARVLVASSEQPDAWARILVDRVADIRRDRDLALVDDDLIESEQARREQLGQPGVITGVVPAPVPSMPTVAERSLRFEEPGATERILYRRDASPVARAPHSSSPLARGARSRSRET